MRWIRIALLCLLVAACASRAPRGLWTDPSLDSGSLAEGVVIGGVVDLTSERDVYDIQQDSGLLEQELRQARPDLPVAAWAEARALLELDTLDAVLEFYRRTGRLGAQQMQTLQPVAAKGRYLALARIDLDQTLYEYTRRVREMQDRTVVDIDPESRRKIALIVDLYDLQTKRLVYTIPVERTGIEHGAIYTVEGLESVPTETEVQNAMSDLQNSSDRPPPADRELLLKPIFREAVKHLP
jgi:hypothetical protein